MNKLTTIVAVGLLVGAGFTLSSTVKAQTPTPAPAPAPAPPAATGHRHQGELEKLTTELSLTPDEVSKIQPIIDAAKAQTKAIRQNTALTPEQQKAQIAPIRKQENLDIQAQLTPDQVATLKSLRKNHGQPAAAPPTPAPAPAG